MCCKAFAELTRRHQVPRSALAKLVKDTVTVSLLHLRVDVKARIAQLGNLFGQELHPINRIAENHRLVDLELNTEGACPDLEPFDNQAKLSSTLEKSVLRQWTFCLSFTKA